MSKSVAIIGTRGYPSYYGGFETLVRELAPFLTEQGWDTTVYGRDGATKEDDPGRNMSVRTVVTKGIESKSLSTLSYGLTSSFDTAVRKPDVALIMNVANGYWLPLLKARGIPTVLNVDGIEWERAKWGKKAKAAFKGGAYLAAKLADRLIFDSHEIGRRWKEDFGRHGDFIPYGGTKVFETAPVDGFTAGSYALIVARFVPENTVEAFFEAAREISREWDVVIVGSSGYGGELDARAQALANSSPKVHWLGHVSDDDKLFSLWQHAGAYFHGHSVGGTNPALVQAMACGAPIVARDTVFNREVLGAKGFFTEPEPTAIAESIRKVLTDTTLRNRLRSDGLQRQSDQYTWDIVCNGYQDSLLQAIEGTQIRKSA